MRKYIHTGFLEGIPNELNAELNEYISRRVAEVQSACNHTYAGSSYGMCIDSPRLYFGNNNEHWDFRYYPVTCLVCYKKAYEDRLTHEFVDSYVGVK